VRPEVRACKPWLDAELALIAPKLRKFLGRSQNAVHLQVIAAMIAYLLLRIAARHSRLTMPAIRFRRPRLRLPLRPQATRQNR
jgi:uracil-DNA glycosylase